MPPTAASPDHAATTRTRAADKGKAPPEPVQESTRTTWRMNVRPVGTVGTPKDIVHVQIGTVGERRNLLGKVASRISTWIDPAPWNNHKPKNFPLHLCFDGGLKQIAGKKTRIWEMELRTDLGEYPALLCVTLDYPRATALLSDLASYFAAGRTDPFEVTFTGKLVLDKK